MIAGKLKNALGDESNGGFLKVWNRRSQIAFLCYFAVVELTVDGYMAFSQHRLNSIVNAMLWAIIPAAGYMFLVWKPENDLEKRWLNKSFDEKADTRKALVDLSSILGGSVETLPSPKLSVGPLILFRLMPPVVVIPFGVLYFLCGLGALWPFKGELGGSMWSGHWIAVCIVMPAFAFLIGGVFTLGLLNRMLRVAVVRSLLDAV